MSVVEKMSDEEYARLRYAATREDIPVSLSGNALDSLLARLDAVTAERDALQAELKLRRIQVADVTEQRDALQAVVDKMPKTADGVPVIPNRDWVYSPSGRHLKVLTDTHGAEPIYYVPEAMNFGGVWRDLVVSDCYSTKSAAEAAMKEQGA